MFKKRIAYIYIYIYMFPIILNKMRSTMTWSQTRRAGLGWHAWCLLCVTCVLGHKHKHCPVSPGRRHPSRANLSAGRPPQGQQGQQGQRTSAPLCQPAALSNGTSHRARWPDSSLAFVYSVFDFLSHVTAAQPQLIPTCLPYILSVDDQRAGPWKDLSLALSVRSRSIIQ